MCVTVATKKRQACCAAGGVREEAYRLAGGVRVCVSRAGRNAIHLGRIWGIAGVFGCGAAAIGPIGHVTLNQLRDNELATGQVPR